MVPRCRLRQRRLMRMSRLGNGGIGGESVRVAALRMRRTFQFSERAVRGKPAKTAAEKKQKT